MKYNIEFFNSPSQKNRQLIENYWKYEDYEFYNQPTFLAEKLSISIHELIKIIQSHSACVITFGNCVECGIEVTSKVFTQSQFRKALNQYTIFCKQHRDAFFKQASVEQRRNGTKLFELKMQTAVDQEVWRFLDNEEFNFFQKLILIGNRDLIFKQLFAGDRKKDKQKWTILTKLEHLGLLRVKRNDSNAITRFTFHINLKNQFVSTKLSETHEIQDNLKGYLEKNRSPSSERQPTHSAKLTFDSSIFIEKNVEYLFSAWEGVNHSISIKLTPFVSRKKQEIITNDVRRSKFVRDFEPKNPTEPKSDIDLEEDFDAPF
jgi:hypothetical protein